MRLVHRPIDPLSSPTRAGGTGSAPAATVTEFIATDHAAGSVNPARGRLIQESGRFVEHGRFATALAIVRHALQANPDDPELLFTKATILLGWGRHREASAAGSIADALGCRHPMRELTMGWIGYWERDLVGAENWMRKAVASAPGSSAAHFGLGTILQSQKRAKEAMTAFERALELSPESDVCRTNIGVCLIDCGEIAAAEGYFRRVTLAQPSDARAWLNLGVALGRLDRYDEALEAFERSQHLIERAGEQGDNFVNLAIHLRDEQRTAEAQALSERMLAQNPSIDGHYTYALALLTSGRLIEGWREYEFRWLREPSLSQRPRFSVPLWNGQDLRGKTLLISAEQGFGDTIQFARYAPQIRAMGAKVLFQVQRGLENLAQGFVGVDHVLGRDEKSATFDFHVHALSLPRILCTDLASIPWRGAYLRSDPDRVARWAPRLEDDRRKTVGIVWAGNPGHLRDRYRSIPLSKLSPLFDVDGIRFVSLQKGPGETDIETLGLHDRLVNLGPELEDFADTAAIVDGLDLVICVDTAIAHLAGAMGKPVWLLLPRPADWRWLEDREDSPWYPTMRLFRQARRLDWDELVDRVTSALQAFATATPAPTGGFSATAPAPQVLEPELAGRTAAETGIGTAYPPGFSAVAEVRNAIVQYLPDDSETGESIRRYGEYLQPQLDWLLRLVRPGSTIVEAGTGPGLHALALSRAVGEAGQLFLYEPRPKLRQILEHNLAANRIGNATVMKRSLGSQGEPTAPLAESPGASPDIAASAAITSETLDELGLEQLTWLKVNDSVSAFAVLDGASDTLWRLRPLLLLRAGDDAAITALAAKVKEFSYRCWAMRTSYFNPDNFNRRTDDVFAGRAALALIAIPEEVEVDITLERCVEIP